MKRRQKESQGDFTQRMLSCDAFWGLKISEGVFKYERSVTYLSRDCGKQALSRVVRDATVVRALRETESESNFDSCLRGRSMREQELSQNEDRMVI